MLAIVFYKLAFQGEIIGYRDGPLLAQLYPSRCHVLKLSNGSRRHFATRGEEGRGSSVTTYNKLHSMLRSQRLARATIGVASFRQPLYF